MAYFNSSGGFCEFATGKWVPFVKPTAIYCDTCAHDGAVPFEPKRLGGMMQCHPWKWAPYYGGNTTCSRCSRPV